MMTEHEKPVVSTGRRRPILGIGMSSGSGYAAALMRALIAERIPVEVQSVSGEVTASDVEERVRTLLVDHADPIGERALIALRKMTLDHPDLIILDSYVEPPRASQTSMVEVVRAHAEAVATIDKAMRGLPKEEAYLEPDPNGNRAQRRAHKAIQRREGKKHVWR